MLEELLQHAKAGQVPGFGFVAEVDGREVIGVTGIYKADPQRALDVIDRVRRRLAGPHKRRTSG